MENREQEERIETLGLEKLKKYACPKNQHKTDWYMECLNCPGVSGCRAGQRVWVILDGQTEPKNELKEPEFGHPAAKKSFERMKEAIASGDPKKWLMDRGTTNHCANETVRRWRNMYPKFFDKAVECGEAQKKQREKAREECREAVASGSPVEYVMEKYGVGRETAYARVSSWRNRYSELFPDDIKIHRKDVKTHRRSTEVAKQEYREAMESGDPVQWLMEHHGTNINVARNRLHEWKKNYGEIVVEEKPMEIKPMEGEQDEISVEEFLEGLGEENTVGVTDNDSGKSECEKDKPNSPEENVETLSESSSNAQPGLQEQFEEKFRVLNHEREELEEKMAQMKERLGWIEKQQEALSMVWAMFNPNTVIGKQLLKE